MDILADKYIMSLYYKYEDEAIADIARRVKKTGRYTETAELMAKSMREQGYSTAKIQSEVMKFLRADKELQKQIAENTKAYKQEIQNIIDETIKEAKENGAELIAEAGNMAWNNDLSMWEQHGVDLKKPNTMSQLMLAFRKQTLDELKNLTGTTGFKNTVFGTTGVMNMYQREMDLALLKVATGTFSYDQVVNDCVHRLAQSGLRSIDYANGRTYQLDTAVRMSVRTAMSQLSGRIMEENLKSSGQDLVITSQHVGSRPEHAPWQNRVFSYSGKSKKYPNFFKETGYGTATGLKGVNCTHDFYPFWEGASVVEPDIKEPEPVTINGKTYTYYEATQKQRRMEQGIRATKREIEAQTAIGGDTAQLKSRLRKQTMEYRQFSSDAGLRAKDNRLRVKAGTSDLKTIQETTKKSIKQKDKSKSKKMDDKSLMELKKLAEQTAIEYYRSGVSGISFGNARIEDVAKKLAEQGSKTSLKKDIRSMQKKLKAYNTSGVAKSTNTGKRVLYNPKANYKIEISGYPNQVNDSLSKAAKELAKVGSDTGYEYGVFVDLSNGKIGKYVTDKEHNSVKPDYGYLKVNPDVKVAFLHNHNEDTELSFPDIGLVANEDGINVVAAVRNDGIITLVESNGKKTTEYLPLKYLDYTNKIRKDMISQNGYINGKNLEIVLRDKAVKEFAKEGIKIYGSET